MDRFESQSRGGHRGKKQRQPERIDGCYASVPWQVMDGQGYQGASHPACRLLFELVRQLNGKNNGHLHASRGWLETRGWNSNDVIQRALKELIERKLIVQTRQGGLSIGPSRFAVTWLVISNFAGLDIQPHEYVKGAYALVNRSPLVEKNFAGPADGPGNTVSRSSVVPFRGPVTPTGAPAAGPKIPDLGTGPAPADGHIVCIATG
jgi:hypothetical protein